MSDVQPVAAEDASRGRTGALAHPEAHVPDDIRPPEGHVSNAVVRELQRLVLSGNLRPGDRLRSERQLASDMGVSRQSVREALRVLEVVGLVERRARGGTYVSQAEMGQTLLPMLLQLRAGDRFAEDIMELRQLLEPPVCSLAAERMTDTALADIKRIHELASRTAPAEPRFPRTSMVSLRYDAAFHVAIAKATGNQAIAALLATLLGDLFAVWQEGFDQAGLVTHLAPSRQTIVDALARRNSHSAWAAMHSHLDEVSRFLEEMRL